jgi:hypothetical protein
LAVHIRQGIAEPWFDKEWRPFWASLSPEERGRYLIEWKASPAWREAIDAVCDVDPEFDLEQDARESEEYLKANAPTKKKSSLFGRLFGK